MKRSISVKAALILIAIVAVAGLAAYLAKSLETRRIKSEADQALAYQTQKMAENLAQAIALFATRDIAEDNLSLVQDYSDELVRAKEILYIAVVDTEGTAVVHTDRSLRDQQFREPDDDSVDRQAAVVPLNRQVATVYVGIRPND